MIAAVASPNGASGAIVRAVLNAVVGLVITRDMESEFRRAADDPDVKRLFQRKGASSFEYMRVLDRILLIAENVEPVGEPPLCRDEDDRKFLHAAVAGDADYLVTFDNDLLDVGSIVRTAILPPAEALDRLRADGVALSPRPSRRTPSDR